MSSRGCGSFLKSIDRYSTRVSLAHKRSRSFKTSCGGVCTILSVIFFVAYLGIVIQNDWGYNYNQTLKQFLVAGPSGNKTVTWTIDADLFTPATKITSVNAQYVGKESMYF